MRSLAAALCVLLVLGAAGCASVPTVEAVSWGGDGHVSVELDSGHVGTSVGYRALTEPGSDADALHCPWVEVDLLVDLGAVRLDIYLAGVPDDPTGELVDAQCYDAFGALMASTRRPDGAAGQD